MAEDPSHFLMQCQIMQLNIFFDLTGFIRLYNLTTQGYNLMDQPVDEIGSSEECLSVNDDVVIGVGVEVAVLVIVLLRRHVAGHRVGGDVHSPHVVEDSHAELRGKCIC